MLLLVLNELSMDGGGLRVRMAIRILDALLMPYTLNGRKTHSRNVEFNEFSPGFFKKN